MSSYANSISFTISSLIICLFIIFLCIRKKGKYISKEYKIALIVLVPLIITELLYPYLQINYPEKTTLINIVTYSNIYLMAIETVTTLLLTIAIIKINNESVREKLNRKITLILTISLYIIPIIVIFLTRDLKVLEDTVTNLYYISGSSFTFIIYYDLFLCLILLILLIIYRKEVKNLNLFSLLVMIIFYIGVNVWMSLSGQNINEIAFFFAGLYLTIYLTFESQDNQLLTEYIESKDKSEVLSKNKTKFLINMSHQIRTPMSTIMGFSDIISREETTEEDIKIGVEGIHNASKELLDIINNILDVSKIESNKFEIKNEEYDIQNIITELQSLILSRIDNKVAFNINLSPNVPVSLVGDKLIVYKILSYMILYIYNHYNSSITLNIAGQKENNLFVLDFLISFYGIVEETNNNEEFTNDIDDKDQIRLITTNELIELIKGKIEFTTNANENIYHIRIVQGIPGLGPVKEDDAK